MDMKLIPACFIAIMLGGCSSMFNIDNNITECSTSGRGTPCVSVRAAYHASQGYDPEAEVIAMEENGRMSRQNAKKSISPFAPQPIQNASGYPSPLLNQAKVMRVWINSYEDEDGNLVYPTRVYTEVEQRKWDTGYSLKRSGDNKGKRVTPLVPKSAPPQKALAEEPASASEAAKTAQSQGEETDSNEQIPNSLPQGLIAPLQ